jgi:hypothetical protein
MISMSFSNQSTLKNGQLLTWSAIECDFHCYSSLHSHCVDLHTRGQQYSTRMHPYDQTSSSSTIRIHPYNQTSSSSTIRINPYNQTHEWSSTRVHPYDQTPFSRSTYSYLPNAGSMEPSQNLQIPVLHNSSSTYRTTLVPPLRPWRPSVSVDPRTTNSAHVSNSSQHTSLGPPRIPTVSERRPIPPSNPNHTYDSCFSCFQNRTTCKRYHENGNRILDKAYRNSCKYCIGHRKRCREMTDDEYRRMINRCLPCWNGRLAIENCSEDPSRSCSVCFDREVHCGRMMVIWQ